jgi:hypothetical protein
LKRERSKGWIDKESSLFRTMKARIVMSFGETPGGREIGVGMEWGGGGQFAEQPGAKVDRIAPRKRTDSK